MNRRHCIAVAALGLLASAGASALDVNVVGLFPNKALIQIDDGALQVLSLGQKAGDDVVLVSVERDGATFDIGGRRTALPLGRTRARVSRAAADSMMVNADGRGHFLADGEVNGGAIRFAVDTGATFITLSARDASRLGIDYRKGRQVVMETANGTMPAYRVRLDTVRLGEISEHDVDAVVTEGNSLPIALLGMSFLDRVDMRREGAGQAAVMTLTKRH